MMSKISQFCHRCPILMCWMTHQTSIFISTGMPSLSCYSRAICCRGTGCFRKESVTRTAMTTFELSWCSTPNLQHLRAPGPVWFLSNGNSGGAKILRALAHARTLRGPRLQCSGAHALDAPVSPRQLYTDHLTRPPSPQGQEIPTLLCRRLQRVRQEGEQRLPVEPMAVGVWAGQASSGGSVGG